jgi:hypothetical protein
MASMLKFPAKKTPFPIREVSVIETDFAKPKNTLERFQADRKRSARSSALFLRATLLARLFQSG